MSSHHIQSLSDPNYLLRLQNLRLSGDAEAVAAAAAVAVQNRRTNSLNGGGNDINEYVAQNNMNTVGNRKPYIDRGSVVSASKLNHSYLNNSSPTHSLSGSSQHSGSPRTSHDGQRILSGAIGPVYENLDGYYGSNIKSTPAYAVYASHYVPVGIGPMHNNSNNSIGGGTYEVIGKKLDPNAGRFAHTPQPPDIIEATPIYENLANVSGKWLCLANFLVINFNRFFSSSGQRANSNSAGAPPPPPLLPKKSAQLHNPNDTSGTYVQPQLIMSQKYRHESPNHSISMADPAARNIQFQNSRNNSIAAGEKHTAITSYTTQLVCGSLPFSCDWLELTNECDSIFQPNFPHPMNISMNPNYIEDINGSDYVCMTRSIPQSVSNLAAMTTVPSAGTAVLYTPKMTIATSSATITGSPRHVQSNSVSSASVDKPAMAAPSIAMKLTSKNLQTLQQQEQLASNPMGMGISSMSEKATSVSPTPSQLSSGSSKWSPRYLRRLPLEFNVLMFICREIASIEIAVAIQCDTTTVSRSFRSWTQSWRVDASTRRGNGTQWRSRRIFWHLSYVRR